MELTLNINHLFAYARRQLAATGEIQTLRVADLVVDGHHHLYRIDVTLQRLTGQLETFTFVQKYTYRKSEIHGLEALRALPSIPGLPLLIDAAVDPTAPEDERNDKLTHWFITPYYPGSTLTFADEAPPTIIEALAQVHVYFTSHLHELPKLYKTVNAETFRNTFDNALATLGKAQREKPHNIFTEAHRYLMTARENPLLYKALAELPLTLTHGDVHPGNMLVTPDGQATLIDWGNARIAPAMLDLANMVTFGSPNWERYLAAWARTSGAALNPRIARLGYDWATIMINAFYLPYAIDFMSPEHVQGMVERLRAAEQRIACELDIITIDKTNDHGS
ncbi:MAG: phosphotransferase [Caldilineaceae bacterium]